MIYEEEREKEWEKERKKEIYCCRLKRYENANVNVNDN
jgi:hypothetical protein